MAHQLLNRRLSMLTAIFAFLGVFLGVVALATNYWTSGVSVIVPRENNANNTQFIGEMWNGLFKTCIMNTPCARNFMAQTFFICFSGIVALLAGGIFSAFDVPKISDHRFINTICIFVGCVLMTAGLVDYGATNFLNSHSSRAMIAAVVFAYAALPISAFIAGQYSALERRILSNNELNDTQKYSGANGNGL